VGALKARVRFGNLYKEVTESESRVTFGFENSLAGDISLWKEER
jgi:hypothetical protein